MDLTDTQMRYLLAIYQLTKTQADVSSRDIAGFLAVKKASVAQMLPVLMEKQLLVKRRYGKIYLTADGFLMAKRMAERVDQLADLLGEHLELSKTDAWTAACAAVCALPQPQASSLCLAE